MAFIYGLKDPETLELKYIGKTCNSIKNRLCQHISVTKRQHRKNVVQSWIQSILNKSLKPLIELIEECDLDKLNDREIFWISYYRNLKFDLKNTNNGGDGNEKGYKFIGRYISPKGVYPKHFEQYKNVNKGIKKTQKHIDNYKKAMQGKWGRKHREIVSINVFTNEITSFYSIVDAARHYNLTKNQICQRCLNNIKKPIKNLMFKYKSEVYNAS